MNEELGSLMQKSPRQFSRWRKGHPGVDADLTGITLEGADLRGLFLEGVDFSDAKLARADLSGARIGSALFGGTDLTGACLRRIAAKGTNFGKTNLTQADLSGGDLVGANFWCACMVGADLSGANLGVAGLVEADLSQACLRRTRMIGARLERAIFEKADLTGADLSQANLERAVLKGANLQNTLLTGSFIYAAEFEGASLDTAVLDGVHREPLDRLVADEIVSLPVQKRSFAFRNTISVAVIGLLLLLMVPFWRPLVDEKGLAVNDLMASYLFYLDGTANAVMGNRSAAILGFKRAVQHRPGMAGAHLQLAESYEMQGERDLVIKEVKLYLKYVRYPREVKRLVGLIRRNTSPYEARRLLDRVEKAVGHALPPN